jgi:hypothetical protein
MRVKLDEVANKLDRRAACHPCATCAGHRVRSLGPLQVDHEIIHVIDTPDETCRLTRKPDAIGYENCFSRYPLMLGSEVLRRLHLFIATQQNQLYFTLTNPI